MSSTSHGPGHGPRIFSDLERIAMVTLVDMGAQWQSDRDPRLLGDLIASVEALGDLYVIDVTHYGFGGAYALRSRSSDLDDLSPEARERLTLLARRHRATFAMMWDDEPAPERPNRLREVERADRVLEALGAEA